MNILNPGDKVTGITITGRAEFDTHGMLVIATNYTVTAYDAKGNGLVFPFADIKRMTVANANYPDIVGQGQGFPKPHKEDKPDSDDVGVFRL